MLNILNKRVNTIMEELQLATRYLIRTRIAKRSNWKDNPWGYTESDYEYAPKVYAMVRKELRKAINERNAKASKVA